MATAFVDLAPLVRPTRGQAYFNPRPGPLTLSFGGCAYTFRVGYGEIEKRYSTRNSAQHKGEEHTDENLFRHFFGDDGRTGRAGECGIRPLFGDERDRSTVEEAQAAFVEAQYAADMRIKMAHMARVAAERASGTPPTSPSPLVQEAMARIAKRDAENGWSSAYACPHCAFPNKTAADRSEHMAAIHPELADLRATPQIPTAPDKTADLEAMIAAQAKLLEEQRSSMAQLQALVAESLSRKKPGPKPKVKPEDAE